MTALRILQFAALTAVLLHASVSDVRRHEVDDWVWIVTALLGLVGIRLTDLPSMILGAAAILAIEVPLAVIQKEKAIGGADIKLSAAAGFLLGIRRGLYAQIIGLTLAVLLVPVIRKIRHTPKDTAFPLVPFLAAGILTAYFI